MYGLQQQLLLPSLSRPRSVHGGDFAQGKRKRSRPISTKAPMHFVLRSSIAKGNWSFLHPRHAPFIRELVPALARAHGVRLYKWSQNGNHLHLLLLAKNRHLLKHFLMIVSARISMKITGARKGKPFGRRFFDAVPFSRIVEWGKAFLAAKEYVQKNILEAAGAISYVPRGRKALKVKAREGP